MDKAVFKYLKKRGVNVTAPFAEDVPFSERAPKFFEWFHKSVLNLDTDEYRREFWHEAYKSGHIIGPVPYTLENYLKRRGIAYRQDVVNIFAYAILMGGSFAVWIIQRQIEKHIRRLKRPTYYETEMVRRKSLARERRKLNKRSTVNPCPTVDEIKNAFQHA
jgi:hypothetical protein